jgi:hypothetical protein
MLILFLVAVCSAPFLVLAICGYYEWKKEKEEYEARGIEYV